MTLPEPKIQNLSRPPIRPSFFCNIFGCENDYQRNVIVDGDYSHGYSECRRCGQREGFTILDIISYIKKK
jgi:hypothetical protein